MPLSRTAAIRRARQLVHIGAHGDQYVIYSPWNWRDLDGPITTSQPADWWKTRGACTRSQATLALRLMGHDADTVWLDVERAQGQGFGPLESIVAHLAAQYSAS